VHEYPTLLELLAMHDVLLVEFGGRPGIRDVGALDAALMRPQLGYYDSLLEEAAALMEGLAMNQAFVDGNKRLAFFATDTFLRMNGRWIDVDSEEAYAFLMERFERNEFRFRSLHAWLEGVVKPLDDV
jgi:death on curing protein